MTTHAAHSRRLVTAVAVLALAMTPMACGEGSSGDSGAAGSRSTEASSPEEDGLSLVVIGDSIPVTGQSCSGCSGFADQYGEAVEQATGRPVTVQNLAQQTGLTLPQLVDDLDSYQEPLAAADVILVGIAHNSFELNADEPCGRPLVDDSPDWSAVDAQCAEESAAAHEALYRSLYSQVAAWRQGEPTILRTINRYNDWIPADPVGWTTDQSERTKTMLDAWNTMLCASATESGFGCADVYHAFNGPDGLKPSADLVGPDTVHPSQLGHDEIAAVLESQGFAPLT